MRDDVVSTARTGKVVGVGPKNDGERFLAFCELTPPRLSDECRTATNITHESAVSFARAFERL